MDLLVVNDAGGCCKVQQEFFFCVLVSSIIFHPRGVLGCPSPIRRRQFLSPVVTRRRILSPDLAQLVTQLRVLLAMSMARVKKHNVGGN